jgi:hypothetical protein
MFRTPATVHAPLDGRVDRRDSTDGIRRVVVGEYLTGIMCAPCQAHEAAFDALLRRYPSTQFIALAYHQTINFPIADPADSVYERMQRWYGFTRSTPGIFPGRYGDDWIDGRPTSRNNILVAMQLGSARMAEKYYHDMAAAIDVALQKAPEAVLHVEAHPAGGTLLTKVRVESLAPDHQDVYVRICVVEDTVRLKKSPEAISTPRLDHYMVVRATAHDTVHSMGLPLHGPGTVSYTFDLAREQRRMLYYWALGKAPVPQTANDSALTQIEEVKNLFSVFPDKQNWLMNPIRLHVVAFVQDAYTGDVLQAAIIPVNSGVHSIEIPHE